MNTHLRHRQDVHARESGVLTKSEIEFIRRLRRVIMHESEDEQGYNTLGYVAEASIVRDGNEERPEGDIDNPTHPSEPPDEEKGTDAGSNMTNLLKSRDLMIFLQRYLGVK